jgi:hypothetical protein
MLPCVKMPKLTLASTILLTVSAALSAAAQEAPAPLDLDATPEIPPWLATDLESNLAPDPATRSALKELEALDSLADELAAAVQAAPPAPIGQAVAQAERDLYLAHFHTLLATALEAERQALSIQAELAAAETLAKSLPAAAPDPAHAHALHRELARATTRARLFHRAAAGCRESLKAPAH